MAELARSALCGRLAPDCPAAGSTATADGLLARRFQCVADVLDYRLTQAQLRIVDAVCDPESPAPADEIREPNRERLRKAFPEIGTASRH